LNKTSPGLLAAVRLTAAWLALTLLPGASGAQPARNVILLIGDGMGYQHVNAGSYYLTGTAGALAFEPYYIGAAATRSANSSVTDSAAAATALATGVKVNNGVISQAPDGSPITTILEIARDLGKTTGLVTTVPITHATPAGFGAHEASRNSTIAIGNDFLNSSQPNVIFGAGDPARGGSGYFSSSQVTLAQSLGYQVVYDFPQMTAIPAGTARSLGLFNGGQLTSEYDRSPASTEPHLSQMTSKALGLLEGDPDGFFLMVESGLIDWSAHSNDIRRVTAESVEFHNTFQTVMAWLGTRTDTLVILTADHETGGLLATSQGAGNYPSATWSTTGHTGANVPVYALGAGAGLLGYYMKSGVADNTDIFRVMNSAVTGTSPLTDPIAFSKARPDGEIVTIRGKVVTAGTDQFANAAYIEDSGRMGGIRIATSQPVRVGDCVDVTGSITTVSGERVIESPSVTVYPGPFTVPGPLGMANRLVGGDPDAGVRAPVVDTTGLLVRVWGRVTAVDPAGGAFALDDGHSPQSPLGTPGLLVSLSGLAEGNTIPLPGVGELIHVTGISSRVTLEGIVPVVRPREAADIRLLETREPAASGQLARTPVS